MAKCPKCGKRLTVFNISQFCPECGVNMRFYNFEETFLREAKYAELSNAVIHCKIRRLKAAFIGSKLTIVRLVVCLLPVVALLIPAGSFSVSLPFSDTEIDISGLGVYNMYSGGELDYIMKMRSSALFGPGFSSFMTALVGYAAVAVIAVIVLLLTVLCFWSIKNMQKIICVFSFIGIAASVTDYVLVAKLASVCSSYEILSASSGFGLFVAAAMFAVVFAVNLILDRKGVPVEYNEGMEERSEIYRKVKKKEISLDDLSQPVVETEETRKIDAEVAEEEAKLYRIKEESANGEKED